MLQLQHNIDASNEELFVSNSMKQPIFEPKSEGMQNFLWEVESIVHVCTEKIVYHDYHSHLVDTDTMILFTYLSMIEEKT